MEELEYKTSLKKEDWSFLQGVFGDGLLRRPEEIFVYASDASLLRGTPLAVVVPEKVEQMQKFLAWANTQRVPVYVRGRGTNLVGDCVPKIPGIVVSTSRLDTIIEISQSDFVAVVEPGVVTSVLQEACEKKGLFYPPDPATVRASSIGGNVSTCAGGMRALKYGVTKDFVLGCEVVLPDGSLINLGGRAHKNVVGLDLSRLMAGSEGTLGFVSKLVLKVLPKPEASASLMCGFASYKEALGAVGSIFAAGILPCALEYIGDGVVKLMGELGNVPWDDSVGALLLMRFDGSRKGLPIEVERARTALGDLTCWTLEGQGEDEEPLWEIRRRINPTLFSVAPDKIADDIAVPRGSIVEAVEISEKIAADKGARLFHYGHVGDGNIHVNLMFDGEVEGEREKAEAAKDEINLAVISLGGTISGEHGIGLVKDPTVQLSPESIELMRRVKTAFDPNGIMNPGKAY